MYPLERDPALVIEDLADAYVSVERAKKDYGVVIRVVDHDLGEYEVDVDATEKGDERTNVFYSVGCSCKRGHPASRD